MSKKKDSGSSEICIKGETIMIFRNVISSLSVLDPLSILDVI